MSSLSRLFVLGGFVVALNISFLAAKSWAEDEPAPSAAEKQATEKASEKAAKEKKPSLKKPLVVKITLRGEYPEGPTPPGIFGELQPSLASLIRRLDTAAGDERVAAVWLKFDDLAIGRGKIYELRAAISRLRKAGKPVFAELTTATSSQYLLAAACEKIFMPPSGMLLIPGVRLEVTFYKGLLDKLGLEFEALQMGKYKGAAEPLCRREMSQPLRESLEALVDDVYAEMLDTIAADRRLKDYQVKIYLDQGLFTAADAEKVGLIDEVLYADQFQETLKERLKLDSFELVTDYKKEKVEADFSGLSGMIKLLNLLLGGKPAEPVGKKPKIAVVYAVGPILEGKSSSDLFGSPVVASDTLVAALRKAADDPKVAAVVLRIDSPGGSATASDLIWRESVRLGKPLVASMGDVAGSGGYYIAMGAKKIIAAPGTLTGSIGVIGGKLVTRGLYDKLGLNMEVIARGANSGSLSPTQPFTPEERKAWTHLLEETYRQFVSKAAEGRKMPYAKLEELAQGRVYSGAAAKKLGLVDELGTLEDAICAAKTAAGLKADEPVDLLILPQPKSILEQLFGDSVALDEWTAALPEGVRLLRDSLLLRRLISEGRLLWMPFNVQVK